MNQNCQREGAYAVARKFPVNRLKTFTNKKANGFKNLECGTSRFLKETHPKGRTRTEAIKSLSWAGIGCSRVVVISFLRHYGRARVIHPPNLCRHTRIVAAGTPCNIVA